MSKQFEIDISFETNFHASVEASDENEAYDIAYAEIEKILDERKVKKGLNLECDFYEVTWSDVNESEE